MYAPHGTADRGHAAVTSATCSTTTDAARALRRRVLAIRAIQWLAIALITLAPLVLDGSR